MPKLLRTLCVIAVAVSLPLLSGPATARPFPHVVSIPVDFQPEGIAVGHGSTFYVSSLRGLGIYRGDLRTGQGSVLPGTVGTVTLGMRVDDAHGYLVAAGGFTGVHVRDAATGASVADIPYAGFLNDVAVTDSAYYFTDTFAPQLFKVPVNADGSLGTPSVITVTGPAGVVAQTFGLNGIDATPDGSLLVVNHTELGIVATVDPTTGVSHQIDVAGIIPGTPDGLQLEGRTLWLVENFANTLAKISLSGDLSSGTIVKEITDPAFEVPTTTARFGSHMALVNGKFDLGFPPPFDSGAPAGTPFEVVVVSAQ